MNTSEFLVYLNSLNIKLAANGTRLKCRAATGVLTPKLQAEIIERRSELLALLQKRNLRVHQYSSIPVIKREQNNLCLSFTQQRLWLLHQLEPEVCKAYQLTRVLRLKGPLYFKALQQAFTTILERHEALRTSFISVDGLPRQVITPSTEFELPLIDLSSQPSGQAEARLKTLTEEELCRPFNLSTDWMLRALLLRIEENEHVLQIVMHHMASDRWSFSVFARELSALYQTFSSGRPNSLPELPIQYVDFAAWQRQWLSGEVLESQVNYWKQHLAGAPPLLELPTDRPRPPQVSYRGAHLYFKLSKSLTDALKQLSQQTRASLFMTLLAAFNTLLYRYTQQEDIVVGLPIANRTRPELQGLIGFFANTLALRTDLSGSPSFRELLERVRQVAFDAYAHQDAPFEKLVEELQSERNLSHSPLFQVMFGLQNTPPSVYQLTDLTIQEEQAEYKSAQYDLTLFMFDEADGLCGRFEYSTDLFEAATIERMMVHFKTLLVAIVANPDESIATLSLLTKAERHQLLVEWNDTQRDYPQDKCIHQLFEEQVERTPDVVAVVFEDQQLTYRELNNRANQLAHYLQQLGVGPEVLVGICVERSIKMLVGLLGILKAGGSYVPLDPAYPQDRLAYMVEDSQLSLLLIQQKFQDLFLEHSAQELCIDIHWDSITQQSKDNLSSGVVADNLAYTIYTSGSTGKPKGVQICHHNVVNFLNSMRRKPGLIGDDCLLAVTTISFDIAVLELYLPLMVGARVVISTREVAADANQLVTLLAHSSATVMQATPTTWQMLLAAGWQGNPRLKMLCGGEAMTRELADQLLARGGELWNMYGPTETTVWSAACRVKPGEDPIPVAGPISNTQLFVLAPTNCSEGETVSPVPIGIAGEVYIGGEGLARGYLNRPDLTQERFIEDPFSSKLEARLYKTGDLARFRSDGTLELLGRIDHQVKVRGFRIELGEIETALNQHPALQQTVVIAREDIPGNKRLVAYLVSEDESLTTNQLREFLKHKLPEYMVPSAFVILEALPLTPNGKVDRKALPTPDGEIIREKEYVAPRTPSEEIIAKIFSEILEVQNVGIYDNFFDELGGHSILATRVISRINQEFSVELSLRQIFETPSISGLALTINKSLFEDAEDDEITQLLSELEGLSDVEVRELLA